MACDRRLPRIRGDESPVPLDIRIGLWYSAVMKNEYDIALSDHSAALKEYDAARKAYRNQTIGDAEFLAARRKLDEANKRFDAAFSAEVDAQPAGVVEEDVAPEPDLFGSEART